MKTLLMSLLILTGLSAQAAPKVYSFQFKSLQKPISASGPTKQDAFKLAAKDCFNQLTGGKYPGEEKGLEIIDICANPKM